MMLLLLAWFAFLLRSLPMVEGHTGHDHNHGHKKCGTADASLDHIAEDSKHMEKWIHKEKKTRRQALVTDNLCVGCTNINVYFHIFSDGLPLDSDADITMEQLFTSDGITNQMEVLNRQFSKSPFQFTLLATYRSNNATLANANEETDEFLIQSQIHSRRRGGKDVLNVYWYEGSCNTECGEATFPQRNGIFPTSMFHSEDYVEMCPECMSNVLLDENDPTLAHEFVGETCDPGAPGDMVDDTPQQGYATNSTECNETQDSCPLLPGFDPIDNYMDYSPDQCQEKFTTGTVTANIEMRFGSGPLTDDSIFQIADKNDPAESLVLITDRNRNKDFSGLKGAYGACLAEKHVHELYLQLTGHTITSSFFVAVELSDTEVFRTEAGEALIYFFVDQSDCGTKKTFTFEMESDDFKSETSWRVIDKAGSVVIQDPFSSILFKATFRSTHCLDQGEYTFEITDSASDGIESPGFYRISVDGNQVKSGGSFSSSESTIFNVGTPNASTKSPTLIPSVTPTAKPSVDPTQTPIARTDEPSKTPTRRPTSRPTMSPSTPPSVFPIVKPTIPPTTSITDEPSKTPTRRPTSRPTMSPSTSPSVSPIVKPTMAPISVSDGPSKTPTRRPTLRPTMSPSTSPIVSPIVKPTIAPISMTDGPSKTPTRRPTSTPPTFAPTMLSTSPSSGPTSRPEASLSNMPTRAPSTDSPSIATTLVAGDPEIPTVGPASGRTQMPTQKKTNAPSNAFLLTEEPSADPPILGTRAPIVQQRATNRPTTEVVSPGENVCFSGNTVVHVQGDGEKSMRDLEIGDMVQVSKWKYEPVYSFCKRLVGKPADFIRITTTNSSTTPLELSHNHFIFKYVSEGESPVAIQASMVRPGDILIHAEGIKTVSQIESVRSSGVYAPYTASGSIIVNGLKASVYASLEKEDGMSHGLLHFLQTHHRMICKSGLCRFEQYSEEGLSTISNYSLKLYSWWKRQGPHLQLLLQGSAIAGLGLLFSIEWALQFIAGVALMFALAWVLKPEK